MDQAIFDAIVHPQRLWSPSELDANPVHVPAEAGIYGWYFSTLPCETDVSACITADGATLLYVGVAPSQANSKSNLRKRLRQHRRDRGSSTLRRSLAALLAQPLGLSPGIAGRGRLRIGDAGEQKLSKWISDNARVVWAVTAAPWTAEVEFIQRLDLPLNLMHNRNHLFWPTLSNARAVARQLAMGEVYVEDAIAERNLD